MYLASGRRRDWVARKFHEMFCHADWNVGWVNEPIQKFLEPSTRLEVHWLPPPGKGRWFADPFGIERDGRKYIICEMFDYRIFKGVICAMEFPDTVAPSRPKVIIETPVHTTHPWVFEFQGEIFCVPETCQLREVPLYRADGFPDRWTRVGALISGFAGIDVTIFQHEGRWWMMCTEADAGANQTLFVWHALDPLGPWRPHAANPVKTGLYGTRPAGTPFLHRGQLYRPAMDNSRTYGRRIVLYRVRKLSPTEFEEEPVRIVEPFSKGPYRDGVHTISAVGDITLVDGVRMVFEKIEFEWALEKRRLELRGLINGSWREK